MNRDREHFQALIISLFLVILCAVAGLAWQVQRLIEAHHGMLGG